MKRTIKTTMLTKIKRIEFSLIAVIFTLSSLMSLPVAAQNEGRWYEVEILLFKRLGSESYTQENWPKNIDLSYPNSYRYLQTKEGGNFSLLSSNTFKLANYSYTLNRNDNYKVLFHKAWRQQMQSQNKSPSIIISAGDDIAGHKELEGSIQIYIARYIHVINDLWLTTGKQQGEEQWPEIPPRPGKAEGSYTISNYPVATFRERRRMRSNVLHYIDHPLMGMLVIFTPIEEEN